MPSYNLVAGQDFRSTYIMNLSRTGVPQNPPPTMTSSGAPKSGPPAHQNRYAFHHNRASRLTQKILALPIHNLCPLCTRLIQWRKQFRKYKPLTVPKRCCRCQEKRVKDAYHVVCGECAGKGFEGVGQCAKCLESRALDEQKRVQILKEEEQGKTPGGEDVGGEEDSE